MIGRLGTRTRVLLVALLVVGLVVGASYFINWHRGSHLVVGPEGSSLFFMSGQNLAIPAGEEQVLIRGAGDYWVRVAHARGTTDVFIAVEKRKHGKTVVEVVAASPAKSYASVLARDVYVDADKGGLYYLHRDSLSAYYQRGLFLPEKFLDVDIRVTDIEWLRDGRAFVQSAAGNIYFYNGVSSRVVYESANGDSESLFGPVYGPYTDSVAGNNYVFIHDGSLYRADHRSRASRLVDGVRQDSILSVSAQGHVFYGENTLFAVERASDYRQAEHEAHENDQAPQRPTRFIVGLGGQRTELTEKLSTVRDVYAAAFSDDGLSLAMATSNGVYLYNLENEALKEYWVGGDRLLGNLIWHDGILYFTDVEALWRMDFSRSVQLRMVADPTNSIIIESGLFLSENGSIYLSTIDAARSGTGEVLVVD